MSNISIAGTAAPMTMTSKEMADLAESATTT